jgi:putative glutamine amidotransferase
MDRPVIGLCTALERAQWSVWDQDAVLLPRNYVDAVQHAGGLALLLPPDPRLVEAPDELVARLDGLLLAGGADIDPAIYGQDPHPQTQETVPERDAFEIALTRCAIERDVPVLGICRGMQLINVAFGGTLTQHLPDEVGHERHRPHPGSFDDSDHEVRLTEGSLAALAAGETVHNTKSHHHQGLEAIAEPFEVTGHSMIDDVPEAIEAPYRRFVLGVQWHPEADERSRVIGALIERARDYRDTRVSA